MKGSETEGRGTGVLIDCRDLFEYLHQSQHPHSHIQSLPTHLFIPIASEWVDEWVPFSNDT